MCKLIEKNEKLYSYTEYNKQFISAARQMGGKWNAQEKAWTFPCDIKEEVENIMADIFGYGCEKVKIKITVKKDDFGYDNERSQGITLFGRDIFYRKGRDYSVMPHHTVSLIDGSFFNSGGSMKNPAVGEFTTDNITFIVRDVPVNLLHEIPEEWTWEKIGEEAQKSKYADYTDDQLTEMIAEIQKELQSRNA